MGEMEEEARQAEGGSLSVRSESQERSGSQGTLCKTGETIFPEIPQQ